MKKLLFICAIAGASFATAQASPLTKSDFPGTTVNLAEKVKISPDELPAPVKTTIDNKFNGWDISEAYMYTETKQYEVQFKHEGQTKTVKFDKDGNVVN